MILAVGITSHLLKGTPHVSIGSGTLPTLDRTMNNALSPKTMGSKKTFAFKPKPDNRFNSKHVFSAIPSVHLRDCAAARNTGEQCQGKEGKVHPLPLPFARVVQQPIEENVPNPKLFIKAGGQISLLLQ